MIQRSHDRPDFERMRELSNYVAKFGYKLDISDENNLAKAMNKLMVDIRDTPEENVISNLMTRCMSKAFYSTKNIGHFGLGFDDYSHFTSPIRRYPDVIAHRLITKFLTNGGTVSPTKVESESTHCSERERLAQKAQRMSIKYKQAEYLSTKIGEVFTGLVSSVVNFGVFVTLIDSDVDCLIYTHNSNWEIDVSNYCIKNKFTNEQIRLGDEVNVIIKNVDIIRKTIECSLLNN